VSSIHKEKPSSHTCEDASHQLYTPRNKIITLRVGTKSA